MHIRVILILNWWRHYQVSFANISEKIAAIGTYTIFWQVEKIQMAKSSFFILRIIELPKSAYCSFKNCWHIAWRHKLPLCSLLTFYIFAASYGVSKLGNNSKVPRLLVSMLGRFFIGKNIQKHVCEEKEMDKCQTFLVSHYTNFECPCDLRPPLTKLSNSITRLSLFAFSFQRVQDRNSKSVYIVLVCNLE